MLVARRLADLFALETQYGGIDDGTQTISPLLGVRSRREAGRRARDAPKPSRPL
jgi:hypothetical protein